MKFHCPAKINLFLKITGIRENGYHELESLFAFLDLYDELEVNLSNKFSLEISGQFADGINLNSNLFTKIIDYFSREFSINKNLEIKLIKNIPIGAGLGGGSSDAAHFMQILNQLFSLNLSKTNLQKIALNFGADIPFFFENKASIIRGIGEKISQFDQFQPISALLINPKINLTTAKVFKNFDRNFTTEISDETLRKKNIFDLISLPNQLTQSAIELTPEIKIILDQLKNLNAKIAKMSGSGSTCFGIFDSEAVLENAAEKMKKIFPDFFIKKVKILSHV